MNRTKTNSSYSPMQEDMERDDAHRVIIACGSLKPEIEALSAESSSVEVRFLDADLHRTPEDMPAAIQREVDDVEPYATRIVLGYGLCSFGTTGVMSGRQGLWIPRAHDCVAFYLGSVAAYNEEFQNQPGTYYLTEAWVNNERDPLGIIEKDYAPRVGYDTAWWAMNEELRHYSRIAFIRTKAGSYVTPPEIITRAKENARRLDKQYVEIEGDSALFEKILFGPYTDQDFVYCEPGQTITRRLFEQDYCSVKNVAS